MQSKKIFIKKKCVCVRAHACVRACVCTMYTKYVSLLLLNCAHFMSHSHITVSKLTLTGHALCHTLLKTVLTHWDTI